MKNIGISLKILLFFIVLTGIIYPLAITLVGQIIFPYKANGSIIMVNGKKTGSELIAQKFDTLIYFSSRPSAINYNPLTSGGSNFGLTNLKLRDTVKYRTKKFIAYNKLDSLFEVPAEMIFASASGLDPHITVRAALLQVNRIANARNFTPEQREHVIQCIKLRTEDPQLSILGEQRINVLLLNLDIDKIK